MRKLCFISFFIVIITSCKEQYDAQIIPMQQSFLVVEGNLNANPDSTIIRLTRTLKLVDTVDIKFEDGAIVTVEGKDNSVRSLIPMRHGYYISPNLGLVINTEYRLKIRTGGQEYFSEYVKARKTPPIDSISWEVDNEGAIVYANTHDPLNSSIYYRWDYDETWEIRSRYLSPYVYDPAIQNVRPRNMPAEEVYYCWKYDTSSAIRLANTTALLNDVIHHAPLVRMPFGDERLAVRYSIHVRQYALDKEAYDFFELMKKNTEQVGAIFSPQPSELKGNVYCSTNPGEYVLGYVTASSMEKARIFIQTPWQFSLFCQGIEVPAGDREAVIATFSGGGYIPYGFNFADNLWIASSEHCVDCRTRKGSLMRPRFW